MTETREEWLMAGVSEFKRWFKHAGYDIPDNVRVTCGFPSKSAVSRKTMRIGECWDAGCSRGGTFEIFISPVLEDPVTVLATLAHELVHATVGLAARHGKEFSKCARAIGLTGKMTATVPGDEFKRDIADVLERLGDYPHTQLRVSSDTTKKQTTRLIKCECPECAAEGEPYIVRLSQSTLDRGAPICPTHHVEMTA